MSDRAPGQRPGLEDVVACETEISMLDAEHERILIRGYDLIDLARGYTFPDVAHLLLYAELPDSPETSASFERELVDEAWLPEGMIRLFAQLPMGTVAMDALRTGLSALAGAEDPDMLVDASREANLVKAVRLLGKAPVVATHAFRALKGEDVVEPDASLGFAENFLWMATGSRPSAGAVRVFDRVLTCYAEHELANSTFTARVVASTLSDIYAAVVAAAAALKGPLHGGANEAAARMFAEIASEGGPDRAEPYVLERLAAGERVTGFGHRVYMRRPDPRALLLREDLDALAASVPGGTEQVKTYEAVVAAMARERDLHPNADLPIGLILSMLGVPTDLFTPVFLCARIAGISAHVIEQYADNRLYRPRSEYRGQRGPTTEP